jgi:hypothetical protein
MRTSSVFRSINRSPQYYMESLERRLQLAASLAHSGTQTVTPGSLVNASNDFGSSPSFFQTEMSCYVWRW